MAEKRRGPGRPAYDSKQKLVAAACALLAERGFEATSPQMFQQRSGVGHGSMYHHFPGKGKEGLALDAISHMRTSTIAISSKASVAAPGGTPDRCRGLVAAHHARRMQHALLHPDQKQGRRHAASARCSLGRGCLLHRVTLEGARGERAGAHGRHARTNAPIADQEGGAGGGGIHAAHRHRR